MKILRFLIILIGLFLCAVQLDGKKIKTGFSIHKEKKDTKTKKNSIAGGNNESWGAEIVLGDSLSQGEIINFAGYEKEINSSKETFLIQNKSSENFTGYNVRIVYLDMQDRMLHARSISGKCYVPAGETRKVDISSWDNQHTYYYYLGNEPKKVAIPYKVKFVPLSVWIEEE